MHWSPFDKLKKCEVKGQDTVPLLSSLECTNGTSTVFSHEYFVNRVTDRSHSQVSYTKYNNNIFYFTTRFIPGSVTLKTQNFEVPSQYTRDTPFVCETSVLPF